MKKLPVLLFCILLTLLLVAGCDGDGNILQTTATTKQTTRATTEPTMTTTETEATTFTTPDITEDTTEDTTGGGS